MINYQKLKKMIHEKHKFNYTFPIKHGMKMCAHEWDAYLINETMCHSKITRVVYTKLKQTHCSAKLDRK